MLDLIELFTHWEAGRSQLQLARVWVSTARRSEVSRAGGRRVADSGWGAGHRAGVGGPDRPVVPGGRRSGCGP